jgi:hypothetical protein
MPPAQFLLMAEGLIFSPLPTTFTTSPPKRVHVKRIQGVFVVNGFSVAIAETNIRFATMTGGQ